MMAYRLGLCCAFLAVACGSTSDPKPTESDAGTPLDSGADTAKDAAVETPACTSASDCRTFENTCGTCSCRALPASAPDPTCSSEPVSCFAPSCTDKVATCENGTCKVIDGH